LPTKYLLPSKLGEHVDPTTIKILTNWVSELEKLQENKLIAEDLVVVN
jgi:hypothetical protein